MSKQQERIAAARRYREGHAAGDRPTEHVRTLGGWHGGDGRWDRPYTHPEFPGWAIAQHGSHLWTVFFEGRVVNRRYTTFRDARAFVERFA